jgi:hypothetical protein
VRELHARPHPLPSREEDRPESPPAGGVGDEGKHGRGGVDDDAAAPSVGCGCCRRRFPAGGRGGAGGRYVLCFFVRWRTAVHQLRGSAGDVRQDDAHRPRQDDHRAALQPLLVADHPQLLRRGGHQVARGLRHHLAAQPGGLRGRAAPQRRQGPHARHVRLQRRRLALPLLQREMLRLHSLCNLFVVP